MNVLSLFDGLSGAKIALDNLGIECNYYASEIDRYAEAVSKYNYPDIIRLGDVNNIKGKDLPPIDLIIGGSPCQGFSVSGKRKGFKDPRSKLFFEFVRLVEECNPKYFLLENVKMKKEWLDIISLHLKTEYVIINSALVTAQNRERCYWANFPIDQPKDRGIVLRNIIEDGITDRDKSYCIDANYFKGGNLNLYFNKNKRQLVFNRINPDKVPVSLTEIRTERAKELRRENKRLGKDYCPRSEKELVPRTDEKANCITCSQSFNNLIVHKFNKPIRIGEIGKGARAQRIYSEDGKSVSIIAEGGGQGAKTGLYAVAQRGRYKEGEVQQQYEIGSGKKSNALTSVRKDSMLLEIDGEFYTIRNLTPIECERLQGIDDDWTRWGIMDDKKVEISNSQRYKMLGNGFTIPVIEHILKEIV